MGELMADALGIGLAATQVGGLRRLLVYRVEADGRVQALINPELSGRPRTRRYVEEGCLSLRGVVVDVERPIHVRVAARDADGEPILVEASGLEARVIQHEMDHLDGVLIIDRDAARPARARRCAPCARRRRTPRPSRRDSAADGAAQSRLPRHVSEYAAAVLRLLAAHAAPARSSSSRRPDRPPGRGRKLTPPPVATLAARARHRRSTSRRTSTTRRRSRAIAAAAPDAVHRLRLRRADPRAAADATTRSSTSIPSLLPRWRGAAPIERAIMAGDARPASRSCG